MNACESPVSKSDVSSRSITASIVLAHSKVDPVDTFFKLLTEDEVDSIAAIVGAIGSYVQLLNG